MFLPNKDLFAHALRKFNGSKTSDKKGIIARGRRQPLTSSRSTMTHSQSSLDHQATLDKSTITSLQTALAHLKMMLDPLWAGFAKENDVNPAKYMAFWFEKADPDGFVPMDKIPELFYEIAGGEEKWKQIGEPLGMYGRERESAPPNAVVGEKLDVKKAVASVLLFYKWSAEEKMTAAFKLADVNGDGSIDQRLV